MHKIRSKNAPCIAVFFSERALHFFFARTNPKKSGKWDDAEDPPVEMRETLPSLVCAKKKENSFSGIRWLIFLPLLFHDGDDDSRGGGGGKLLPHFFSRAACIGGNIQLLSELFGLGSWDSARKATPPTRDAGKIRQKKKKEEGNGENGVSPVEEKNSSSLLRKRDFHRAWRFLQQQKQNVLERERERERVRFRFPPLPRHCCSIAAAKGLLWFPPMSSKSTLFLEAK